MARTKICGDDAAAWTINCGNIAILAYVYSVLLPERKSWVVQHHFLDGRLVETNTLPVFLRSGKNLDQQVQQLVDDSLTKEGIVSSQSAEIEIEGFRDTVNSHLFELIIDSNGSAFLKPRDLQFLRDNEGRVSIDMTFSVGKFVGRTDLAN